MEAKISITVDNAAFSDGMATELGRILRKLAGEIEAGELPPVTLMDINGNKVGFFDIEGEPGSC